MRKEVVATFIFYHGDGSGISISYEAVNEIFTMPSVQTIIKNKEIIRNITLGERSCGRKL